MGFRDSRLKWMDGVGGAVLTRKCIAIVEDEEPQTRGQKMADFSVAVPDVEKNAFERLLASFHFSGRNAFCVTGMNSKLS